MVGARRHEPRAGQEGSPPGVGGAVRVLVDGEATGGRLALLETRERRGAGPPRHVHMREDELVYVLAGRLTVEVDGEVRDCPAGSCLLLPRGGEHTYQVESTEARLLVLLLPAGLEGCYRELGSLAGDVTGQPAVERLVATAARYGVEITGPGVVAPPRAGQAAEREHGTGWP